MRHLNNDALCAIWIETTGEDPRKCDIVEICIILVDNFIRPSTQIIPFYNQIMSFRPENIDLNTMTLTRTKLIDATKNGIEPSLAADRLESWFDELDLPLGKKIVPLTFNWPLMREYLHTWLGYYNFKSIFSEDYRDLRNTANFINDSRNQKAKQWIYPKSYCFSYIGNQHDIEVANSDDVMVKALKMIEIYRAMLTQVIY